MKPKIRESRVDYSGGVNISAPVDGLNANELRECSNARVGLHGGIIRRIGSRKLNTTALPAAVIGVFQWNGEVVAVTGTLGSALGDYAFHHAATPYETFSTLAFGAVPGSGANQVISFASFLQPSPANLTLFIANNGTVHSYNAGVLTLRNSTNGVPNASACAAFGNRMFYNDYLTAKSLTWSKIGDGTDCRTGGISDGGLALVDTYGGDALIAMDTVGSSLLLATSDSIARFSGTGDDIQILQNSFGVTTEVGPLALGSFKRIEQMVVMQSSRGAYVVTEAGALPIGNKVTSSNLHDLRIVSTLPVLIAHNRRRNEAWFAYAPIDSGSPAKRTSVLVYNYRLQAWYGRFQYPFGITSMDQWTDDDGVEGIMAGCDDGFIRVLDDINAGSLDDGISDYDATVEFAPFIGGAPYSPKALERIFLEALGNMRFVVSVTGDLGQTDEAVLVP